MAVNVSARSSGTFANDGPIPIRRMNGGRRQRNTRSPGIETSSPNGYVTRSTVCPRSVRARMRWNSLNGVPRGSKNGSGAIIRMRTVPMIFARNDSTVSHPFANAPGATRIIPHAPVPRAGAQALGQRHPPRRPLLAHRRRAVVADGERGVGPVAARGDHDLRAEHRGGGLALEPSAEGAAHRDHTGVAPRIVPGRHLL